MQPAVQSQPASPRALVADDDIYQRRAHARLLEMHGFNVTLAENGKIALDLVRAQPFDVVLSDISMPEMDGLTLLRKVREYDLDLPVLLLTGAPSRERAAQAVEHGAFRLIVKPADPETLVVDARIAVAFVRAARVRREALLGEGAQAQSGDRAALEVCFDRALEKLWMAFQPIVSWKTRSVYAFEALVRSAEPALPHPGALLDAADDLDRMRDLGRRIRERTARFFGEAPTDVRLFVNLHTSDLTDELLISGNGPFAGQFSRITLEVTERASLHRVDAVKDRVAALRKAGYSIALDDLGAGYAGLSSLALLEPEVIKLDMSLVRNIHRSPLQRRLVVSMIELARDLGQVVVAEGVETTEERDALIEVGCDLFQGYLFAKPGPPFPVVQWP